MNALVLDSAELALDRAAGRRGLWALRHKDVDALRGVVHVRQTVKPDVARRDAGRATVDMFGREVAPPKKAVYDTVVVRARARSGRGGAAAEKQGLRFHDQRRTRATLLIAAGRTRSSYRSGSGTPASPRRSACHGHMLSSTEAALVDARDAIHEQWNEGDDAAAAQGS
jgi:hypothetical protein